MTWSEIALICVSVVLVILIIAIIAINVIRRKDKHDGKRTDELEVIDGVRYTKDDVVVDESGKASVTLKKGDIMLERGRNISLAKTATFWQANIQYLLLMKIAKASTLG